MPATTDQLSPYLDTLRRDVDGALRAAAGLAEGVGLSWESHAADASAGTGSLSAQVEIAGERVDVVVEVRLGPAGPTLELQRPRLTYQNLDELAHSADYRLYRRLSRRLRDPATGAAARLLAALQTWWRHGALGDWIYRQITGDRPRYAMIRLGFRCNQRCGFCWQGRDWPDPPLALVRRWIEEVAALGLDTVTFSGGEPTVHPHLVELTRLAHHTHHLDVVVQTNAIRFRDQAYLAAMLEAGMRSIFVSYHSADPAVSDAMTGAPGSHGRTRQGIEACLQAAAAGAGHPQVRLNCVVERSNVAGLAALARDIVERFVTPYPGHGVRSVEFSYPNLSFDRERWVDAVAPLDEAGGPLVEAARILRAAGVEVVLFTGCGFPICVAHDAPELLDTVNPDNLDAKDVEGRRWPEECTPCALRSACLGLRREYVEVHGTRGLAPFSALPSRSRP